VDTFVLPAPCQAVSVSGEDDMPYGYRVYTEAGKQKGSDRAFRFDDTLRNGDRTAGKHDKGQQ
jgi:hypothetical protein